MKQINNGYTGSSKAPKLKTANIFDATITGELSQVPCGRMHKFFDRLEGAYHWLDLDPYPEPVKELLEAENVWKGQKIRRKDKVVCMEVRVSK